MSEQKPSTGALMAAGIIAFETGRPSADRLRFAEIIDRETRVAELEETMPIRLSHTGARS